MLSSQVRNKRKASLRLCLQTNKRKNFHSTTIHHVYPPRSQTRTHQPPTILPFHRLTPPPHNVLFTTSIPTPSPPKRRQSGQAPLQLQQQSMEYRGAFSNLQIPKHLDPLTRPRRVLHKDMDIPRALLPHKHNQPDQQPATLRH